jgi:hypothetical protein
VFHRLISSLAGRPVLDPLPFLAITALVGVASVVGTVYTPAYAVCGRRDAGHRERAGGFRAHR